MRNTFELLPPWPSEDASHHASSTGTLARAGPLADTSHLARSSTGTSARAGPFDGVRFVQGFFSDSLPGPIRQLALLRIDADMYASTTIVVPIQSLTIFLCIVSFVRTPWLQEAATRHPPQVRLNLRRAARTVSATLDRRVRGI